MKKYADFENGAKNERKKRKKKNQKLRENN
jgi:hypothetical protein